MDVVRATGGIAGGAAVMAAVVSDGLEGLGGCA